MASIGIMIGGAILNAAAFTGGNYLAKYLAGDSGQAALAEKKRHDKALEAYRRRWRNTRASAPSFLTGLKPTEKSKLRRTKTSRTPITRSSSTTRPTRLQINSAHSAEILGHVSAK